MDISPKHESGSTDNVLLLNGLFFLRSEMINSDDPLIKETVESLYRHVTVN